MQANLSIINDVEAVRQLVNAGHGDIVASHSGILVPFRFSSFTNLVKLGKAGFRILSTNKSYTVVK